MAVRATFRRDIGELDRIFEFIESFSRDHVPDESLVFVLKLVIEELFTNMVRHSKGGSDGDPNTAEVPIELAVDRDRVVISLTDRDSDFFDPRQRDAVDIRAKLKERVPGGLGIHLVRHLVDELDYQYVDRTGIITLHKRINRPDAQG